MTKDRGEPTPQEQADAVRARQDGDYQPPVITEPVGGPIPTWQPAGEESVAAAADDRRDDAVAALLAAWPALAAPLVGALSDAVASAAVADLPSVAAPTSVVSAVAAGIEQHMADAALAEVDATVTDAAAHGVTVDPPTPDGDRVAEVAAVTAALIAGIYTAAAVRKALQAGPDAVREVLVELGTATTGMVADHLGMAIQAARNIGRQAVFLAHPPAGFVADEHDDRAACQPCREVNGKTYATLDEALSDYVGNAGYRGCLGGIRCRGHIRARWT